MKEQLRKRLDELKAEYESGQRALAELEAKEAEMRSSLSRICGSIQVLEEQLGGEDSNDHMDPVPTRATSRIVRKRP
ncbi:MAG TPA: hypothetical protein VGK23_00405 [Methanomassiliicoccales archaeon]|jgi:predicted nuclease with TOPRIM domain